MICKHKVDAEAIRGDIMNQVECFIFLNISIFPSNTLL